MGKRPKNPVPVRSTVNIGHLTGKRRGAIVKEEIVQRGAEVVRYSLAYINPRSCGPDNGRVLGYDNSHGHHHRHLMGQVSAVDFPGYKVLMERFEREVRDLWRKEDEQRS